MQILKVKSTKNLKDELELIQFNKAIFNKSVKEECVIECDDDQVFPAHWVITKPNVVWVVFAGAFDEEHIVGIYSDENAANTAAKLNEGYYEWYEVEE
jgi:hypothetical protein